MQRDNGVTRRYLAEAGVRPGQRVLEIGSGGGRKKAIKMSIYLY